jgi:hypothetical protein
MDEALLPSRDKLFNLIKERLPIDFNKLID